MEVSAPDRWRRLFVIWISLALSKSATASTKTKLYGRHTNNPTEPNTPAPVTAMISEPTTVQTQVKEDEEYWQTLLGAMSTSNTPSIATHQSTKPSPKPTVPQGSPSTSPSSILSIVPSTNLSNDPSLLPSQTLSQTPSVEQSTSPSAELSQLPSAALSSSPSSKSSEPSTSPSQTIVVEMPSVPPSAIQSSLGPSTQISANPSRLSAPPSQTLTIRPSGTPSASPLLTEPSQLPSMSLGSPSVSPSNEASMSPSTTTFLPVDPTGVPTLSPVASPSTRPSMAPSPVPSPPPGAATSNSPSSAPNAATSNSPSLAPSAAASISPSLPPSSPAPSFIPSSETTTAVPSATPSIQPSSPPTVNPAPSIAPTQPPTSTGDRVTQVILEVAIFDGAEFENLTSYQSQALEWLKSNGNVESYSDEQLQQRYALASIYYATFAVRTIITDAIGPGTPPGWLQSGNWITDADECTWYGVTCRSNQVSEIQLFSNRLTGTFPPETTIMASSLVRIDLFNNFVWNPGDANNAWLGQLSNIQYLFFGRTNFDYPGIPTEIGLLTSMIEFDCSSTLYFGPLRDESFQDLVNLEYLDLSSNSYNQTIPTSITSLPKLEFLFVEDASVTGDLSFMEPIEAMAELRLGNNPGLRGMIPADFIGQKTTLTNFYLSECSFTGTIPTELGLLTRMVELRLNGNEFDGNVPSELGELVQLQSLQLQENNLMGDMPSDVCDLRPSGLGGSMLSTLVADCNSLISCPTDCCTACLP